MAEEIINFLLTKSKLKVSKIERDEIYEIVKNLFNKPLITERNISFKSIEDNYNFGNYFISKDRESESSIIGISEDFRQKYFNKDENEIFTYLKKKNLTNETINKFMLLYNTFIVKRIKINKEIVIKDIFDYVID
ncbi:hypothetical protein Yalta_087 [Yalta virus]|nr:hypothetical protein Yalta_087 [Yalta virus]